MHSFSQGIKKPAVGVALAALLFAAVALPADSARAEPNPCAGRSTDSGTGGQDGPTVRKHIYGTWYNCGSTAGTDHVKIDVGRSVDGPCIAVPYGSTGSSDFYRAAYIPTGPAPFYEGWKRC